MSREIRNLVNSSNQEASLEVGVGRVLPEGGSSVNLEEGRLVVKRKYNTLIYKSFMSRDGNEIVDKNLDVGGRVKSKITAEDLIFKQEMISNWIWLNIPIDQYLKLKYKISSLS